MGKNGFLIKKIRTFVRKIKLYWKNFEMTNVLLGISNTVLHAYF